MKKLTTHELFKKKSTRLILAAVAVISTVTTMAFVSLVQPKTTALKETSPFYSTQYADRMFYVEGRGDLTVAVLRKYDGTETGPLGWCLNKDKQMPTTQQIPYESFPGAEDEWSWELTSGAYPTATQVDAVQRALFGYNYLYKNVLTDFGLESTDNMSLYHAMQLTTWSILENWSPEQVLIKDEVKDNPTMYELAEKIHTLYRSMYRYATNTSNLTYTPGIRVLYDAKDKEVTNIKLTSDNYSQGSNKGYFRSELLEVLPKQSYGYYSDGEYAFTYKVVLEGAPEGARVVNELGVEQDTFSTKPGTGLEFYIEVPADVTSNGNFNVKIQTLKFRRSAPILWTPVSDTAYQAIIQSATIPDDGGATFKVSYEKATNVGAVAIDKVGEKANGSTTSKTDYGTLHKFKYELQPLQNAEFELYYKCDDMIFTATDGNDYFDGDKVFEKSVKTDVAGKAAWGGIPLNADGDITEFTIKEVSVPKGYLIKDVETVVSINSSTSLSNVTTIENKRVKTSFEFTKYAETKDGTKPLEGAVFGIYTAEDYAGVAKDSLVGILTSDANGKVNGASLDLPAGTYYQIKELKTASNLELDKNTYFVDTTITNDMDLTASTLKFDVIDIKGEVITSITNKRKTATLDVVKQEEKYDSSTNKTNYVTITDATGYEFKVYDDEQKTTLLATLNASKFVDGKFQLTGLDAGTYYVEETKAPNNFKMATGLQKIDVVYDATNTITFKNELKRGGLEVVKKEETLNKTSNEFEYVTITDATGYEFEVYYGDNTKPLTTLNKDNFSGGKFTLTNLVPGTYKVVETKAKAGYEVNSTKYTVVVTAEKTTTVEIKNDLKTDGLSIVKQEEKYNPETKKFEYMNITDATGYEFKVYSDSVKRTLVATLNADNFTDGKFTVGGLKPNTYYVVETKAPTPYVVNENTFTIELKVGEENVVTIQNDVDTFDVKLYKKDNTNANNVKVMSGVKFDLIYDGTVLYSSVTDETGTATFLNVNRGLTYEIVEHVPNGYIAPEETLKIETDEVTRLWEATIYNQLSNKLGSVNFLKVDKETQSPLAGATVGIYRESDKEFKTPLFADVTDKDGKITFTGLTLGENYVIHEMIAPTGWKLAEDILVDMSDVQHGETKTVTMEDEKIYVDIKVVKTASDTNLPMAGVKFGLYDKDMKLIKEGLTDDNGELVFANNTVGKYFVKELEAPQGYMINETAYPADVLGNETEAVVVNVTNTPIKVDLTIVKVDKDNNNIVLKGAEFGIYLAEDTEFTNELYSGVTGEDGQLSFKDLTAKNYIVVEKKAPEGYKILTEKVILDLTEAENGQIYTLTVYNEKIREEIDIDPEIEPTPDSDPELPVEPDNSDPEKPSLEVINPDTGVDKLSPWTIGGAIVVLIGLIGLVLALVLNKKKK